MIVGIERLPCVKMLPLYLLTNAKGQQMSIELKNGEIIEGELTNVDNWMNLTLSNVTQYDSIGNSGNIASQKEIIKSKEVYLRGTYIKYINLQDGIIDQVKQQINNNNNSNSGNSNSYRRNTKYNNSNAGGNYRKNNQGRRNYNSTTGGNRRPYQQNYNSNQARPNSSGMGGYVQQHQNQHQSQDDDNNNANVEF